MTTMRRFAWAVLAFVDVGFVAWGAMAALAPDHLWGPASGPILAAGYEGFTKQPWSALAASSPMAAGFMTLLFRTYGAYNVAFGLVGAATAATAFRRGERWAWWALLFGNTIALAAAMRYDWMVNAIGPFELSEYAGLALVWAALAVTAPFRMYHRDPWPDPSIHRTTTTR